MRQRIRRDRDETVRRAKETIAHSKELLREADITLTRVQFGDTPGSRSLNSCSHVHDYWLYANDKDGRLIGPAIAVAADDDLGAVARVFTISTPR